MRCEQLLNQIYDAAVDAKAWSGFTKALEDALGGGVAVLSLPHPSQNDSGELFADSLDPRAARAYRERYFAVDPWTPHLASLRIGAVALGGDLLPEADVRRGLFHRDWLEPYDLCARSFLGGIVERDAGHGTVRLSVYGRAGEKRLGSAARHVCETLMPHLRRAAQIHLRKAEIEAERRALHSVFDRLPLGLILLDRRGRVRATNRAADRILAQRDGLALERDGLRAATLEACAELERVLTEAGQEDTGRSGPPAAALVLPRADNRRALEALVAPISLQDDLGLGAERCVAAVFVSDPEQGMEPPRQILRRLYGLTPSEAALACELGSGRTIEEAAEHLGVTRGTARQRLGNIFAKTSTARQAALVRLLLTGPAQLQLED